MPRTKNTNTAEQPFAFYDCILLFINQERKRIYQSFTPLTRKYLDFNNKTKNATAFLRAPQFEALEVYAFLKEYCHNKRLWMIYEEWYNRTGAFENRQSFGITREGQTSLFGLNNETAANETTAELSKAQFERVFQEIKSMQLEYPNYIFALTMGLGKTILMATLIFYEFLLANKYRKEPNYCHNILVFAPDKTVLDSLREIQTFDKSKVVPPEYLTVIESKIQFHFLEDAGGSLNILDNSDFNVVITNVQKIILKKEHKQKSTADRLFDDSEAKYKALTTQLSALAALAGLDEESIEEEINLQANARFQKILRLKNLGIFVDEAHHVFGTKLQDDLMSTTKATSLRVTINEIAAQLKKAGTQLVLCCNFTGTPYVKRHVLPEVVYSYGLKKAIEKKYLKRALALNVQNVREDTLAFVRYAITTFWDKYGKSGERFEGMLPKIAFYASSIDELQNELRPLVEQVLSELNINIDRVLVNVGDDKITSNDDLREFKLLDTPASNKQFILLVNKGKEGWNCRSLFAVALYREPSSKVFVLQATMRCLRQITNIQQQGLVFLSDACFDILDKELNDNFNLSIDSFNNAGTTNPTIQVHIVPPKVNIKLKRLHTTYKCERKENNASIPPIDFKLATLEMDKYRMRVDIHAVDDTGRKLGTEDASEMRTQRTYSAYSLTAEIARYIHESPIFIRSVLEASPDGIEQIVAKINEANELLYSEIIPNIFRSLYDITEETNEEEMNIDLTKDPKDGSNAYTISYKEGLLASLSSPEYQEFKDKSFNLDNYCFDSQPEKDLFWTLLHDKKVAKVWFTGMLTNGQTDFFIRYINPETGGVNSYYPDFLTLNTDGSYTIIEVKGDNKINDAVVLAKQQYAQRIATSSNMKYFMLRGSDCSAGIGIPYDAANNL